MKSGLIVLLILATLCIVTCTSRTGPPTTTEARQCVERVLAADDTLGRMRNHACTTVPLSTAIRRYADALEELESRHCPQEFVEALEAHRQAWIDMLAVTDAYPEMRGEMHDLFDEIGQGPDSVRYKVLLRGIWDTWEVVEEQARSIAPNDQQNAESAHMLLEPIDHLVYVVTDLESGMDTIEKLLGVRPARGGRHPAYGTHNALVALGPSTYLEIIARDNTLDQPARGSLFGSDHVTRAHLATWALTTDSITTHRARAVSAGIALGEISRGSRDKPDVSTLSWSLTDPYAMPMNGAIPFLIDWGETPHPAASAPQGGTLIRLHIRHPGHEELREALAVLGAEATVECSPEVAIVATIQTDQDTVVLY